MMMTAFLFMCLVYVVTGIALYCLIYKYEKTTEDTSFTSFYINVFLWPALLILLVAYSIFHLVHVSLEKGK